MAKTQAKTKTTKKTTTKTTGRKTVAPRAVRGAARRKTAARAAASRRARTRGATAAPSALASAATAIRGTVEAAVSAVADRLPGASRQPDALALLEADHRRFEDLLKRGTGTTARAVTQRTEILKTLTAELTLHELVEEKLLYPALEPHPEARAIVLEGTQEHHVADVLLTELRKLAKNNDQWGAKFKVLQESIEHHIDEEEGKMFRLARGVLGRDELHALGGRIAAMKAKARRGQRAG